MKNFKSVVIFISVLVCVCANALPVPLLGDPAAIPGWTNTTQFNLTNGTSILNVTVEYAVFAAGSYTGNDISGGNDFIYAYQIFNNGTGSSLPASTVAVDFFSVGISMGSSMGTVGIDAGYGTPSGVNPMAFNFPQSAGYIFPLPLSALNQGQHSMVLLFSSVHAPMAGFGTISGGGLSGMGMLPAPSLVPEPATMALLIPAILVLRKKRNSK
jgi:hypothetical protein